MGSRGAAAAALACLLIVAALGTSSVVVDAACSGSVSGLSPCYDAVKKGGSTPTKICCGIVNSWGLSCLCSVLTNYAGQLPSTVDIHEILGLPKKCKLTVPKDYTCARPGYTIP